MNVRGIAALDSSFAPLQSDDMAEYVTAEEFSKKNIIAAGKAIVGHNPKVTPELIEAFKVAHRWRDSYRYPMMRIRHELSGMVRRSAPGGITAARLKRMQSIRRKLKPGSMFLYQMQDIGGCRAILPSIADVDRLINLYRSSNSKQPILRENDYVAEPRPSGYRGHHIIFKFSEQPYARHYIELQLRTELQHSWATAVEAVGLVRNENLKAGEGNSDWLRLFELMSAEFSSIEQKPIAQGVSSDGQVRQKELGELVEKLDAIRTLESFREAIKYTESFIPRYSKHFLIQYDNDEKTVRVRTFDSTQSSSEGYISEEKQHASRNTVLVEVDKVDDLRAAYPNYFLDVELFTRRLIDCVPKKGRKSGIDLSWLNDWRR